MKCAKIGNIARVGRGRINSITVDCNGKVIGCHGNDDIVELFYFLHEDQIKTKKSKRLDKLKKKAAK